MAFAVGSLVKAREREWVVLPESSGELLVLRPLGGTEEEVTGIYLPLERVESATFDLPNPDRPGDYRSCRLLRDALRLGFRSSAGPFRSFAHLGVEPRPYQLVPLLMALKLDPVRLLIADDVGIGKSVEAALIARELLDRGEIRRLAVLCPPQLAEQWQAELRDKFHIDAELVLPSTVRRLERDCRMDESLFDQFPYVVISTDFIKSDRRREEFQRTCPEFVIVDEAHTCASSGEGRGARQQRHQLVTELSARPDRHLVLVTATPHSGKEEAFRSLLRVLDPAFAALPDDLTGRGNETHRRRLAAHLVQRRRGNLQAFLGADTPFPQREEMEASYELSPEYLRLFDRVLRYAREIVQAPKGEGSSQQVLFRQRVRWWSALGLLRSLASSPAAAAATLRNRAAGADTDSAEEADELGRRAVMDLVEDEPGEGADLAPGSDLGELDPEEHSSRRRLLEFARAAEDLCGKKDHKLRQFIPRVKALVEDGYQPIVFCRFIPTAEYLAAALRDALKSQKVEVASVTGLLPPEEREERILQLGESERRVLVCTDCLSEGINLQEHFNAVVHYDLSWNPTRHEQREGRVDRYGQESNLVRVLTYYGVDNQIDGIVLDVLLRKHKAIRGSLGISVPVPEGTSQVLEAIFQGLLLREQSTGAAHQLSLFEELLDDEKQRRDAFHGQWQGVADREQRSRSVFAQEALKVEEVAQELEAMRSAMGSAPQVASFLREVFRAHGGVADDVVRRGRPALRLQAPQGHKALQEAMETADPFFARFELPVKEPEEYVSRTHPKVTAVAAYVMDSALDPSAQGVARRCGVLWTDQVERRSTLLLLRVRYHIVARRGDQERPLLAEDCLTLAFTGSPRNATWLDGSEADRLLQAEPKGPDRSEQASSFLRSCIGEFDLLRPHLQEVAEAHGQALLEAHTRVRTASRDRGPRPQIETQLPPDVLGLFIYLPA
ncbi:MAG TPA: helicase-related protein [Armatimonadota bacterium]|jgi:superfamily II DNA or RNA helicase